MKKNHALFVTNRLIPNSLAAIITIVQLLLHFDCEWWVYCLSVAHHTHIRAHTHTPLSSHLEWFDLVQSQVGIRAEDDRILVVAGFGRGWKLQLHLGNNTHTQKNT